MKISLNTSSIGVSQSQLFMNFHFYLRNSLTKSHDTSGKTLYPVEVVRDHGGTVSAEMSWSQHIQMVASRAKAVASWALSGFQSRDKLTMITPYKSLVRSHLEHR